MLFWRSQRIRSPRWLVAAALSAAVTSSKPIGDTPNSQAEPTPQKQPTQTPTALRERGVWGERRFSQRSGLSPQRFPTPHVSSGGGPGEALLFREAPPPEFPYAPFFVYNRRWRSSL